MVIRYILAVVLFATVFSCSKDDPVIPTPKPSDSPVNLSALEAGQQSIYYRYESTCSDIDDSFSYTGDTLLLDVIEENGQLFFQESLTEHSTMRKNGQFLEPIKHRVIEQDDFILIPERWNSALFFFYANDTIWVEPQHDVQLAQDACRLIQNGDPFIGNDIGIVPSFEVGPLQYENKTAISCEPFFNLDAYLIYDAEHLYMSHVLTFGNPETVLGWVAPRS